MSECSICENQLTGGDAPFQWVFCKHCCWQELEQQVKRGCKVCGLICQALVPSETLLMSLKRFWIAVYWRANETVGIKISEGNPFQPLRILELYVEPSRVLSRC
jgi:hypothetical protein